MSLFVYLLRCSDGSFYTGHTDDLERRVAEHAVGEADRYVARRRPFYLVWVCRFATRLEALERERQIKGWPRARKQALVTADWERLHQLARPRTISEPTARSGTAAPVGQCRDARGDNSEALASSFAPSA